MRELKKTEGLGVLGFRAFSGEDPCSKNDFLLRLIESGSACRGPAEQGEAVVNASLTSWLW